ncbi:MAG: fatty acid desaturase [Actinomycetota bacterium]|jgi:beta-carotene hydroxylase
MASTLLPPPGTTEQAGPRVDRRLRGVPDLPPWQNPTLWLFVFAAALVGGASTGYVQGWIAPALSVPVSAVGIYLGFTVLHESVHRLVHKNRFLNDILGWPTGLAITLPQTTFRAVHLMHHSQTNNPQVDPDFFVGQGPWWQFPVRMLSPLWEYRIKYFRGRWWRNRWELAAELATELAIVALVVGSVVTGRFGDLFILWLAPAMVAVIFLAWAFDKVPHTPYDSRQRFFDTRAYPSRLLNWLLLGQNYHLVHHAWVTIAWFRYEQAFRAVGPELASMGARVNRGDQKRPLKG